MQLQGGRGSRRVTLISLHFAEYAFHLAHGLSATHKVQLMLYEGNASDELGTSWRGNVESGNIEVVSLARPRSARKVLSNTIEIFRAISRFAPDVIHLQMVLRDEVILPLVYFKCVPLVMTVHDPQPHSSEAERIRKSRFRYYATWAYRRAERVIAHGSLLCREVERLKPSSNGRVRSVAHGPLGPQAGEVPSLPSRARMLFFGRIHAYKGLGAFVAAIRTLHDRGVDVTGVIAGTGPDLARHCESIHRAGCFELFDGYVPVDDVGAFFRGCTAVVLPYTDGTQSGVAAMALGYCRPVIATAVGSIPELVRDGVNGLLVPVGNVEALISAIESLVRNPRLVLNLAAGARQLRDGPLSWSAAAADTGAVYDEVCVA